jgi:hypothetical protein
MKQDLCRTGFCSTGAIMNRCRLFAALLPLLAATACLNVKAHIIVDVNVKVDKALDDFFGDLDKKSATIGEPAVQK